MQRLALVLLVSACGESAGGGAGPFFEQPMFFNEDVSSAKISSDSTNILAGLRAAGGWGRGDRLQIDFSMDVLEANATTPHRAFTPTTDFFYAPDCDHVDVPVPEGGNVEGEPGYACTSGGDCHLLVIDRDAGKLYEMYKANLGSTFVGGCLAVWETAKAYDETLRGDECASADAAGFPIAPMLFTADEVAAGEIDHAIRFVLPNDRLRRGFVRPAVHGTDTDGPTNGPPYGVHLRLRGNYPLDSLPNEGARVVARALQKYGMIHADGGEVALTAASDRHTAAKWAGLLDDEDLEFLRVEDFEVVDHGPMVSYPYRCTR
jgi:serine/threonine-protein kinase